MKDTTECKCSGCRYCIAATGKCCCQTSPPVNEPD